MLRPWIAVALAGALAASSLNCSIEDAATSSDDLTEADYVDCEPIAGVPGKLPKDDRLSPMEQIGRCSWVLSTGRTSANPNFQIAGKTIQPGTGGTEFMTRDIARKNGTVVPILEVLEARSEEDRVARWKNTGLVNDPGCKASTEDDEYGLRFDTCIDKYSSGTVGLRRFDNPFFTGAARDRWMALKAQGTEALHKAYRTDPKLEPPYLLGVTCGTCHTALDPGNPPEDPAHPRWSNIKFSIGNQYFREGNLFKGSTGGQKDFKWHVLDSQQPGTSDTSRIATDHINNPNAINPVYSLLSRPLHTEKLKKDQVSIDLETPVCPDLAESCASEQKISPVTALGRLSPNEAASAMGAVRRVAKSDGEPHRVHSILKGGDDSVGAVGATLRVYVNIGLCSSTWVKHFDPIVGASKQTPIGIHELYDACDAYNQMLLRAPAMILFLATQGPIYLKDAPGGAAFVKQAAADQGKVVFAENCATCHSSKQPPADVADKTAWFREAIQKSDWLDGNFLSDDLPHPVTEIGTNIGRAGHRNHMKGQLWSEAYASQSYDERKWPGEVILSNPFGEDMVYEGPDGGPGYYRTPTLIGVWARAPLMHNRSLGLVDSKTNQIAVPDPSVEGRVSAFEFAARMLLIPEYRPKTPGYEGWVKTTAARSELSFEKLGLHFTINVPAGTPVNLLANLDPNRIAVQAEMASLAIADRFWRDDWNPTRKIPNDFRYANSGDHLMHLSNSPDLIENKGHYFGKDLSRDQKDALIEYLKTL